MKLLKTVKGRILAGSLVVVLAFGGGVAANSFGFINELAKLLGFATDKAADATGRAVTSQPYEDKIRVDVTNAANRGVNELAGHAGKEITRGNGAVETNYKQLKADIDSTVNTAVDEGKTKITNKVDSKVTEANKSVNEAAEDQIKIELAKYPAFTGK
ncbi:hypothetical protein [Bacillus sp. CECT 9360]|uniref:hypothetical protein n=1 Tax=Bacillus sp. CECT 9360 TaxID=2845821 RepID=UPI001E50FEFD|nr:hypothetical protein [Bacillus sp. CECT 9360]CAH0344838.1 hypothetical protein BCI9360_01107 [Bacillus sp. CECT 9360]